MNHAFTRFLEPLEGRRHLSAHPLAITPRAAPVSAPQQAQFDWAVIEAYIEGLNSGMASAAPLATPPANSPGTDVVTELSSPDGLDQLLGSSGSPVTSAPSNMDNGLTAGGSALFADGVTIDSNSFNG